MAELLNTCPTMDIEVFEDKCFYPDKWLYLGQITISAEDWEGTQNEVDAFRTAIKFGQFTWHVPSKTELGESLKGAMGADTASEQAIHEALQDISRRLLLMLPTFDVETICSLPLKRPVTVVVDTSSVLQGGLDFVSQFMYPMARIKVPAVVPLEILNMADNFLSLKRDNHTTTQKKDKCLRQHIKSQGGQRALLRLEWHSDIEVERPIQGNDPLRMIFDRDKDPAVSSLNLTTVQRSYADRFVYETAKDHQSRLSPDHPVRLLTSDQGLARMTLAEGMQPIYFEARKTGIPFGKKLTGTRHHPFKTEVYSVSLTSLIWELATCFGSCRLVSKDKNIFFQVTAMAEDLIWFPYQSKEDVLWCRWSDHTHNAVPAVEVEATADNVSKLSAIVARQAEVTSESIIPSEQLPSILSAPIIEEMRSHSSSAKIKERITGYAISSAALLHLVGALSGKVTLSKDEVLQVLGVKSESLYGEYKSFLTSGELARGTSVGLEKTQVLDEMWTALVSHNLAGIRYCLCQIPSFAAFVDYIEKHGRRPDWNNTFPMRARAMAGYKSLAEVSASAMSIPQHGICTTNNKPSVEAFCEQALDVYDKLSDSDAWVLTGELLENLAWSQGIAPVNARELLDAAHSGGLINRYFEGSTPDTRFASHTLDVLECPNKIPTVKRYQLYQGDFMSEHKASVRIKIERRTL